MNTDKRKEEGEYLAGQRVGLILGGIGKEMKSTEKDGEHSREKRWGIHE
jgi:hypothetical protein